MSETQSNVTWYQSKPSQVQNVEMKCFILPASLELLRFTEKGKIPGSISVHDVEDLLWKWNDEEMLL